MSQTEIGAFADHPGAHIRARDTDRIVGAIANMIVAFPRSADISADAAEPEQVDARLQDCRHHLEGRGLRPVEIEQGPHFQRERDGLERTREHAAALRDQRLVVILPARPRQVEHAQALGMADGRVGQGIDEDVAVIESRDEPGHRREQHAIAEDVAGHVAHTGSGEGHGLDIGAKLAEMAFDGFPRSARGDAHLLVVIALAAAGGESIAKPMALLGRDSVGDVGKGGGALVGGDDEIGVIAIVPHGVVGRHDCVTVEIIGEFEQRANEDAIGFSAFRHPGIAIGGRRQAFGHEAAFGADRHDDGILDLLCLD